MKRARRFFAPTITRTAPYWWMWAFTGWRAMRQGASLPGRRGDGGFGAVGQDCAGMRRAERERCLIHRRTLCVACVHGNRGCCVCVRGCWDPGAVHTQRSIVCGKTVPPRGCAVGPFRSDGARTPFGYMQSDGFYTYCPWYESRSANKAMEFPLLKLKMK